MNDILKKNKLLTLEEKRNNADIYCSYSNYYNIIKNVCLKFLMLIADVHNWVIVNFRNSNTFISQLSCSIIITDQRTAFFKKLIINNI